MKYEPMTPAQILAMREILPALVFWLINRKGGAK